MGVDMAYKIGDLIYRLRYGELESGVVNRVMPKTYHVRWNGSNYDERVSKDSKLYDSRGPAIQEQIDSLNKEIGRLEQQRLRWSLMLEQNT